MSKSCRLFQVDAFTRQRFCGNRALVVLDADDLSDEQMQTIASELMGETAFVLPPESSDHDVHVRFFTPDHEVPFVGHVTIATQYVLAKIGQRRGGIVRQRMQTGIAEVEISEVDGDFRVAFAISPPTLGPVLNEDQRSRVMNALGIPSHYLNEKYPLQLLTKGGTRLMIGLRSPDLLSSLKPDMAELTRLTSHIGADGYFVFSLGEQSPQLTTHSRMFCPAIGIPEDPVSGNAHGMLGTYLVAHNFATPNNGSLRFTGMQGEFVRRPGRVEAEITCAGSSTQSVRISGDAVIVYEATLPL